MLDNKIKLTGLVFLAMFFAVILTVLTFPFIASANHQDDEPTVTTQNANRINSRDATLNGEVDGNDSSTRAWFEYGTSRNLGYFTTQDFYGSGEEELEITIYGLYPNTTYYFRAVAENRNGIDFGSIKSLKTDTERYYSNTNYYNQPYYQNYYEPTQYGALSIKTESAVNISNTSAELYSNTFSPENNFNSWFEWGRTPGLGFRTVTMSVGASTSGRHVHTLTNLSPNTTYYFRAVAENGYSKQIGALLSFTTSGPIAPNFVPPTTNTIIIREPVIIRETVQTTTNTQGTTPAPITPEAPSTPNTPSDIGANVVSSDSFLPQNLFGWFILAILSLILVMEIRYLYAGRQESTYNHH